jgi:hypothetical protein
VLLLVQAVLAEGERLYEDFFTTLAVSGSR